MEGFGVNLESSSLLIVLVVTITYFILILTFGTVFGRFSKNTTDFFYSGQRFPWWLIAASMVATGIGSYSYLKYSEQGFVTGMSSAMTYTNDWFILPLFMFGWLPIIYFTKVKSIPEYFERRFNKFSRYIVVVIILAYMFFYIGYNLFTIGVAIEGLVGFPMEYTIPVVAIVLGAYVTFGGQSAVIFTDLVQGIILYAVGGILLVAGIIYLGGFTEWWDNLPLSHRSPFPHLTENPGFNTAGLFWGEALAGSIAFTFMNQGFIMRYLAAKSVNEGRKAAVFNVLVTLPVSAVVVGCVGWLGKSIIEQGSSPIDIQNTYHTFMIVAWEIINHNTIIFGVVVAALTAALMSTIDTLINACAAIGIYDIYKPLIKPKASEKHYLKAARVLSIIATLIGLLLVIVFAKQKGSLMAIHYKGVMVIIPAIVTTIFLGAFWPRFTALAASVSMIVGSLLTLFSVFYDPILKPITLFVGAEADGEYTYMRALFGMVVTASVGIVITLFSKPKSEQSLRGLTIQTIEQAITAFKGGFKPNHDKGKTAKQLTLKIVDIEDGTIACSEDVMEKMKAVEGDLIFIQDQRWYLAGIRSFKANAKKAHNEDKNVILISKNDYEQGFFLKNRHIKAEKII